MRIGTAQEASIFFQEAELSLEEAKDGRGAFDPESATITGTIGGGHPFALATLLCEALAGRRSCVLINEFGIWPSTEDRNLFGHFRRSFDQRSLWEAPAHFFDPGIHANLVTLVHLAIHFGWGVIAVSEPSEERFMLDHDGHLAIWCREAKDEWYRQELLDRRVDVDSPAQRKH